MRTDPSFPFYASDWLGSTSHAMLTPAQRGAYIDLLAHQWGDKTCSLPNDDEVLARLSGLHEKWLDIGSPLVHLCFPKHPRLKGRIANPRLLEIRKERDNWREKSQLGGKNSAKTRRKASNQGSTKGQPTPQPKGNTPSPSPSPSPLPEDNGVAGATPRRPTADRSDEICAVFDFYRTFHPTSNRKPSSTSKEWRQIRARLEEGYSVDDLKQAIEGNHRSPLHCGENERGKNYHALGLITRDASHVDQFMEIPDKVISDGRKTAKDGSDVGGRIH